MTEHVLTRGERLSGAVRRVSSRTGRDAGMVLLEMTLVIPILLAVAAALAWGVSLGAVHSRVADAARMAARLVALGANEATIRDRVHAVMPSADISSHETQGVVSVTVSDEVAPPVPLLRAFTVRVSATTAAALEPINPPLDSFWVGSGGGP